MVPDETAEWFGIAVMSCAAAWAAVWLRGDRLARWHGVARFIVALVLMLAVGGLSCVSHLGLDNAEDLRSISISHGVSSAVLLLGMMLSGRSCRSGFRRGQFMRRLFSTMFLVAMAPALLTATIAAFVGGFGAFVLFAFVQVSILSVVAAGMLYLLNLPFMLMAFNSPFYGERFHALFCPERLAMAEVADAGIPGSLDAAMRGPEIRNASPDASQL